MYSSKIRVTIKKTEPDEEIYHILAKMLNYFLPLATQLFWPGVYKQIQFKQQITKLENKVNY